MESTVTVRGQTAIPVAIRKHYHIEAGMRLRWVDDGMSITVVPVPKDPLKAIRGKIKDVDLVGALLEERRKERERV